MRGDTSGGARCWPCTVANSAIGLVVGWLPLATALFRGRPGLVALTFGWAVLVTGYTGYRLLSRGYLPGAERVAKRTGLHGRLGPGATRRAEPDRKDE